MIVKVSSLVSSHPWVCVFDYLRQHTHSSFHDYEIRLENPFVPFMINIVNCCHAMDLHCLYMFLNVMGTLGCLELRFLYQKYDFCTSGLMNVRLSVHCSLKRTKRREESPVRLPVRSRIRLSLQPQHNIFEKFPRGPKMSFEARFLQTFIELRTPQF